MLIQNTVGKHEYLGEYTGELITHREADKRGKIYDRENSSFLFNLNDQVRVLHMKCYFPNQEFVPFTNSMLKPTSKIRISKNRKMGSREMRHKKEKKLLRKLFNLY